MDSRAAKRERDTKHFKHKGNTNEHIPCQKQAAEGTEGLGGAGAGEGGCLRRIGEWMERTRAKRRRQGPQPPGAASTVWQTWPEEARGGADGEVNNNIKLIILKFLTMTKFLIIIIFLNFMLLIVSK